ncbi:MAG: hypothetical protein JSV85_00045 [Candidatus Bathyarchaeota archaeon]|nr:MAG: hypothetical protein JSV85_00045 [Candidatus Bathyarchaeota archaeon]
MPLSEEQRKLVSLQTTIIGYMLANYEEFGDDALEVAQEYFYELGKSTGQRIKQEMGITKTDASAVAIVMNVALEQIGGVRGTRVEGDKVVGENTGFCPMMEAVKILNGPWEIVCKNYSWRWFEGLASSVNPNITMEVPESRIWGKERCFHVITIPK